MSNLSPEDRCYLRGAAREQDQSKAHRGFLLSQAHEDAKTSKEKRAAADRRKERVNDRLKKLENCQPILSLRKLKKKTMDGITLKEIKEQLSWHKRIGHDINIPPGFHSFRKARAWVALVRAVWRHVNGVARENLNGICVQYLRT